MEIKESSLRASIIQFKFVASTINGHFMLYLQNCYIINTEK